MKQVQIPDDLEIKFSAKELGEIRDYLSKNFIYFQISPIIQAIEIKMTDAYMKTQEEEKPKPIGGGGGSPLPPKPKDE
jgi:hypothetical protein